MPLTAPLKTYESYSQFVSALARGAYAHADAARVVMPHQGMDSKTKQNRGDQIADGLLRKRDAEKYRDLHPAADCLCVAQRDRTSDLVTHSPSAPRAQCQPVEVCPARLIRQGLPAD